MIHKQFNNLFAVVKNPVYQLMDQGHPGINIYENVLVFWVWENQNPWCYMRIYLLSDFKVSFLTITEQG